MQTEATQPRPANCISHFHGREQLRKLDAARSMLLVNGLLTKRMDIEVRRRLANRKVEA